MSDNPTGIRPDPLELAILQARLKIAANDHPLRALGVARMADNECAILVCFNRAPSDDELRALHDALRPEPKP